MNESQTKDFHRPLSVCDELREELGPDEVFSRMTVLLEDTAARYPDLRGGVRLGFGGTLDHAQLEERARKITGDRESVVRRALGEMVTYLEFELRNHPRIEDPEMYLDAVEDLRAKLDLQRCDAFLRLDSTTR